VRFKKSGAVLVSESRRPEGATWRGRLSHKPKPNQPQAGALARKRSAFTEQIERARATPIEEVVAKRGIRLRRSGKDLVGPCPHCGGIDRFAVNAGKQNWNCRSCKTETGAKGDVIGLVMFLDGCDFCEAVERLAGGAIRNGSTTSRVLSAPKEKQKTDADYQQRQREKARWLWLQSQPIKGTPAERYLREDRGISLSTLPATLRYLPPLKPEHHPAMIAPYGFADEPEPGVLGMPRKIHALHLTLLKPDGSGKAEVEKPKMTIASPLGRPIVIAPANDLLGGAISEGIEDALTVHQATGLGAWAAGSSSFMPALADVTRGYFETVTIFAHNDGGKRDALKLADLLFERGVEVFVQGLG
jgi:hypothetical protein